MNKIRANKPSVVLFLVDRRRRENRTYFFERLLMVEFCTRNFQRYLQESTALDGKETRGHAPAFVLKLDLLCPDPIESRVIFLGFLGFP